MFTIEFEDQIPVFRFSYYLGPPTVYGGIKRMVLSRFQQSLGQYYTEQGWSVHVFPWVVGVRGLVDRFHIESLQRFLCVQQKHWLAAVEHTVLASVLALHFLHRVRFGGLQDAVRPELE